MRAHAIEGTLGGYKKVEDGVDYTHWILDKKAFKELWDAKKYVDEEVPKLKNKIKNLETDLTKAREVASQNYDYVEEHKATMQAQKERYNQIIQESENNKKTIDKVLAVCKERANKERKLPNKKENPGYVLLSSEESIYKVNSSFSVKLFKTVVQLPFFTELSSNEMVSLYNADNQRKQFFIDIGIGEFKSVNMKSQSAVNEILTEEAPCCFVDYKFKRNFVKGFWEMTIVHNSEVVNI